MKMAAPRGCTVALALTLCMALLLGSPADAASAKHLRHLKDNSLENLEWVPERELSSSHDYDYSDPDTLNDPDAHVENHEHGDHFFHDHGGCPHTAQFPTIICVVILALACCCQCRNPSHANKAIEDVENYMKEDPDEFTIGDLIELKRRTSTYNTAAHLIHFMLIVNLFALLAFATRVGLTSRPDCSEFFYGRYVAWLITLPMMMWVLGKFTMQNDGYIWLLIVSSWMMIWAGWLADMQEDASSKWGWFAVSCVCYLPILHFLNVKVRGTLRNADPTLVNQWGELQGNTQPFSESVVYKSGVFVTNMLGVFFNFYIVFWVCGNTGVISRYNQNMGYNVLDTLTKLFLSVALGALWPVYIIAVGPTGNEGTTVLTTGNGGFISPNVLSAGPGSVGSPGAPTVIHGKAGLSTKIMGSDENGSPDDELFLRKLEKPGSHLTKTYDPLTGQVKSYNWSYSDLAAMPRFFQMINLAKLKANSAVHPDPQLNKYLVEWDGLCCGWNGSGNGNGGAMFHIATQPQIAKIVLPGVWRGIRNPTQDLKLLAQSYHRPREANVLEFGEGFLGW